MDQTDIKILEILQGDGRATLSDMAKTLGLTPPTVSYRIKRLEEVKIIQRYVALLNAEMVNRQVTALIAVNLDKPTNARAFIDHIRTIPEVMECYHVTGDMDYQLKVRTVSTSALESIITNDIRSLEGVVRTRTSMILSAAKEETRYRVTMDDIGEMVG